MSPPTQPEPEAIALDYSDTPLNSFSSGHEITYPHILCSEVIGIAGGLVTTAYYYMLEGSLHLVWQKIPDFYSPTFRLGYLPGYVWIATTTVEEIKNNAPAEA